MFINLNRMKSNKCFTGYPLNMAFTNTKTGIKGIFSGKGDADQNIWDRARKEHVETQLIVFSKKVKSWQRICKVWFKKDIV